MVLTGSVEFALAPFIRQTVTHNVARQRKENGRHPCTGKDTVPTSIGPVLCLVPTEQELKKQLKDVGGLNKYYAAVTKDEADKFANLLPGLKATVTPQKERAKPFPIIWSYFSSAVTRDSKSAPRDLKMVSHNTKDESRNPKSASRDADLGNNIVSSKNTRCVYSGEQTEQGCYRLCSECQKVSQLNSDRFPRYINEVACDSEKPSVMKQSVGCHRNQGMCVQRFLFVDFLVRTEKYVEVPSPDPDKFPKAFKQVWEPYTQKIRSCCECQIAFIK